MMNGEESGVKHELCQVRVELTSVHPLIWRQLLVPSNMTLMQLHPVLQCAMGWEDSHSYTIESGSNVPLNCSWPNESLGKIFAALNGQLIYLYDPGDGWMHEITLEERVACDVETDRAICMAGERACPPEDCGGAPGNEDVLKAIQKPSSKRHAELREWIGPEFDPLAFSVHEVNRKLSGLSRRSG